MFQEKKTSRQPLLIAQMEDWSFSILIVIVGSLRKKPRDNLTRGSDGGLGPFRCVSRKSPPFLQSRPKNVTESGSEAGLVRCFTEPSRQISD